MRMRVPSYLQLPCSRTTCKKRRQEKVNRLGTGVVRKNFFSASTTVACDMATPIYKARAWRGGNSSYLSYLEEIMGQDWIAFHSGGVERNYYCIYTV